MADIYIGKIVGTHGIKGELKIISDFEKPSLIFQKDFPIYIEKEKHVIRTHRMHQNKHLVTVDSFANINDVLKYVNKLVYVKKEDINYNGYLLQELVGFYVYEQDECYGKVNEIMKTKAGYLLKVKHGDRIYYIPFIKEYIQSVNTQKKIVIGVNIKGLML